jgi:hypothetical protein
VTTPDGGLVIVTRPLEAIQDIRLRCDLVQPALTITLSAANLDARRRRPEVAPYSFVRHGVSGSANVSVMTLH